MGFETSELEAVDRLIGEVLANRYLVEFRLGEGAMGAVYKAKHVKVGRAFAVKVLHPRLLEDRKTLQRFEREAELAGRLRHPNVIGVVDVGETGNGMRYMVMDFAEGADLATLLSDAPFPPERVIHLTRQLLEGLYHAHEQGLIHRDFKPENVIVEKDTHGKELPRIVDFGIAILREGGDSPEAPGRLTTNGLVLGTPHYMAPEQAVADPIDHRIDLFALGIIVYEMLCGKLPFDGSGAEVARANLLLDPPRISERVPYLQVDPLLEAFARRLMAKKRDMRPPTAKAAREILDLIGRDRDAAAAALGVSTEAARPPMETEDATPLPRHAGDHPGTFPPPIRAEASKQPPPLGANVAVPLRGEAALQTQLTHPVGETRKRWPLIAAVLVGVAGIATAAAVLLGGKHEDRPAHEPVAMATSPAGSAAATPIETKPAETPPVETKPAPPSEGSAAETLPPVQGSAAVETKPAQTRPAEKPHLTTRPKQQTKVETRPVETKPVETAKVTPPVDTKPRVVDTGALVAQYKAVGSELKAFEQAKGADAASDLQARYRMIRITDAMSTQDKRDAAAQLLSKLHADIAARH
jgi:serine/threonine-protein kinase